jgi:hypothetical protein
MPNGFYGSSQRWAELTVPLKEIDREIETFAASNGMDLSKDSRGWPSRRVSWVDELRRAIEIHMVEEEPPMFHIGASAFKDVGAQRFWKSATLEPRLSSDELRERIGDLLSRGYQLAASWRWEDLEPALPNDILDASSPPTPRLVLWYGRLRRRLFGDRK